MYVCVCVCVCERERERERERVKLYDISTKPNHLQSIIAKNNPVYIYIMVFKIPYSDWRMLLLTSRNLRLQNNIFHGLNIYIYNIFFLIIIIYIYIYIFKTKPSTKHNCKKQSSIYIYNGIQHSIFWLTNVVINFKKPQVAEQYFPWIKYIYI